MNLKFYNTLTKKIENFTSLEKNKVGVYSCGPTVYSVAHIGNMRSFLFADVLKRTLRFLGFEVTHVMNITDVGHLTFDDAGEDKLLMAAKKEKKTAKEIADFYTEKFLKDSALLNILTPDYLPRATAYIDAQIALIKKLEEKNYVYQIADGMYFDTSKFPLYGMLSGQKNEEKQEGARVKINREKRNPSDFALWKLSNPTTAHPTRQMEWESPWGKGFPGWHIECSAMSRALLGQPFDIHTGGIDLISPHHENEIAQSVAAFDTPLAHFWMHGEFILINSKKMAKSEGNVYSLDDLIHHGFDPLSFRYLCLNTHYRTPLHFSFDALSAAETTRKNIRDTVRLWPQPTKPSKVWIQKFSEALAHDLNTSLGLAILWDLIKSDENKGVKGATLREFDKVFGLNLDKWIGVPLAVPQEIEALAAQRNEARLNKDFARADLLRAEIESRGFCIEDNAKEYLLKEK